MKKVDNNPKKKNTSDKIEDLNLGEIIQSLIYFTGLLDGRKGVGLILTYIYVNESDLSN